MCIFKEIILGLQAKSKEGKTMKGISVESMINSVWPYPVFKWLVLLVLKMVDYYLGCIDQGCVPGHDYSVMDKFFLLEDFTWALLPFNKSQHAHRVLQIFHSVSELKDTKGIIIWDNM